MLSFPYSIALAKERKGGRGKTEREKKGCVRTSTHVWKKERKKSVRAYHSEPSVVDRVVYWLALVCSVSFSLLWS